MSTAELRTVIDKAVTYAIAHAREAQDIRSIVDEVISTRRDEIRGPPGPPGQDAP